MISYVSTDQLNLRPYTSTIKRLEELARRYKGDAKKKNEVALEILERYADFWEEAEERQRAFIDGQRATSRPQSDEPVGQASPAIDNIELTSRPATIKPRKTWKLGEGQHNRKKKTS